MSEEFKAFLQGGLPMLIIGMIVFIGIGHFANELCDKLGLP